MNETTAIATEAINQLLKLGPEALTVGLVIALGYIPRWIPQISNKLIPLFCIVMASILYTLIGDCSKISFETKYPVVVMAMIGTILGVVAWALHDLLLSRFEKMVLGKFGARAEAPRANLEDPNRLPVVIGFALVCVTLLTGCMTATNADGTTQRKVDPVRMSQALQVAAEMGVIIALQENPDLRSDFETAVSAVDGLLSTNNFDPQALREVLAQHIDVPADSQVWLTFSAASALYRVFLSDVTIQGLDQTTYVSPALRGIVAGLRSGLKLVPPPKARSDSGETPGRRLTGETPIPPMPPGQRLTGETPVPPAFFAAAGILTIHYTRDRKREHRAQIRSANGKVLFVTPEGYKRRRSAEAAIDVLSQAVGSGKLVPART